MSVETIAVRDGLYGLIDAVPALAGHVYRGRVTPLPETELVGVHLAIEGEDRLRFTKDSDRVDFTVVIDVICAAAGVGTDVEALAAGWLDTVAAAIGSGDSTLGGRVQDVTGIARDTDKTAGGAREIGRGRLTITTYLIEEI